MNERDQMIMDNEQLVTYAVVAMGSRLPAHIEKDDLYSVGVMGLMDAMDKFDGSRGVLFKTFAAYRIKGAILDHLRSLDWVPRSVRSKSRQLETAYRQTEQNLGRMATETEVAEAMGLELEDFHSLANSARAISQVSLEGTRAAEDVSLLDTVENTNSENPLEALGSAQDSVRLRAAIATLPEKAAKVVSLRYFDDTPQREIAEIVGVTEGRVSQILNDALGKLRTKLAA